MFLLGGDISCLYHGKVIINIDSINDYSNVLGCIGKAEQVVQVVNQENHQNGNEFKDFEVRVHF